MNKQAITVENGVKKVYEILLEFTSNDTNKKYVIYHDGEKLNAAYYEIDNDLYIIKPIESQEEIDMCKNIIEDIKKDI